jgi:flagellar protein FliO/FliZ
LLATRLSVFLAAAQLASANALAEAQNAAVPGVSGASFLQGLLGLAFIIALLVGAAWLFRRLGGAGSFGNNQGMRIVSGIAVGPRERILLLEIADTWVVVGVSTGRMTTLHTLPKGELPSGNSLPSDAPFAAWLKTIAERKGDGQSR